MIDKKYKLVIFDLDGTLYHQPKLRLLMLFELLLYYIFRPHKISELRILKVFRREREKHAFSSNSNIRKNQYKWCAEKTGYSESKVKKIVETWMQQKALKHLKKCQFKNIPALMTKLNRTSQVAVYSDYPAKTKLQAMKLDIEHSFCSEQDEIDALKPNPKGLFFIINYFNIDKEKVLFIGDRDELDGACARAAGIDYIIIDHKSANNIYNKLIEDVRRLNK